MHLLELAGIGLSTRPRSPDRRCAARPILAEQPAQHRRQLADDLVEVEHARLQDLLPAEREQLAGQRGRALRPPANLDDVGAAYGRRLGRLSARKLA